MVDEKFSLITELLTTLLLLLGSSLCIASANKQQLIGRSFIEIYEKHFQLLTSAQSICFYIFTIAVGIYIQVLKRTLLKSLNTFEKHTEVFESCEMKENDH